jgi:quinol monooxygenase YgiN
VVAKHNATTPLLSFTKKWTVVTGQQIATRLRNMSEKSNASIVSTAKVRVHPERKRELFVTLRSLLDLIKNEEGCCGYRCFADSRSDDTFLLLGEWESPDDWDRHTHSENFTVLMGTLGVLGKRERHDFNVSTLIG